MSAPWFLYVAGVSSLCALASFALERVAQERRWPSRWLWIFSLGGAIAAPTVAWVRGDATWPSALMLAIWIASSVTCVVYYALSFREMRRERRRWRVILAEEMPVWVSERTGPAVVGWLRSIVVTPAWALEFEQERRRLLLAHESQHVDAWDPLLMLLGFAAVALMPWNVVLWWQLRRLRLAIEIDCDARVLRTSPDVERYGELLLDVGARVSRQSAPIAAFAEGSAQLDRRIRAMTMQRGRHRLPQTIARLAVAALCLTTACYARCPRQDLVAPQMVSSGELNEVYARLNQILGQTDYRSLDALLDEAVQRQRIDDGNRLRVSAAMDAVRHYLAFHPESRPTGRVNFLVVVDTMNEVIRTASEPRSDGATLEKMKRHFPDLDFSFVRVSGISSGGPFGLDSAVWVHWVRLDTPPAVEQHKRGRDSSGSSRDDLLSLFFLRGYTPDSLVAERAVPCAVEGSREQSSLTMLIANSVADRPGQVVLQWDSTLVTDMARQGVAMGATSEAGIVIEGAGHRMRGMCTGDRARFRVGVDEGTVPTSIRALTHGPLRVIAMAADGRLLAGPLTLSREHPAVTLSWTGTMH